MRSSIQLQRVARSVLLLVLLCALSGCVPRRSPIAAAAPPEVVNETTIVESLPPSAEDPPSKESAKPTKGAAGTGTEVAKPAADTTEAPADAIELATEPAEPVADSPPPPSRREVVILFSETAPAFAAVANRLVELLPSERYRPTLVDVDREESPGSLDPFRGRPEVSVVAVGLPAARRARDELSGPIVFAQVFNYQELIGDGRPIRGVSAMPPLDLQLRDWQDLDPDLGRVGLIVSESHDYLIGEAQHATRAASVTLEHAVSASDQETLYLFKRLAPQIDGLWLFPDERILSPAVLRELMNYAVSHGIGVSVFSESLLSWGALLSASVTADDVARTVRRVLESGSPHELTPLSEVQVHINEPVARRLGLTPPPRSSWVVRGER